MRDPLLCDKNVVDIGIGTRVRYRDNIYEVNGIGGSLPKYLDCTFRYVGVSKERPEITLASDEPPGIWP